MKMISRILAIITAVIFSLVSTGTSGHEEVKSSTGSWDATAPFQRMQDRRPLFHRRACSKSRNEVHATRIKCECGLSGKAVLCDINHPNASPTRFTLRPLRIRVRGGGDLLGMDADFDDENEETVGEWMGTGLVRYTMRPCH